MSLPHMTNPKEVHTDHLTQDVARWENEGGAPSQSKSDELIRSSARDSVRHRHFDHGSVQR